MKKLLIAVVMVGGLVPAIAIAKPVKKSVVHTPLPSKYLDAYCYPGGSYWKAQLVAYPVYYSDHDADFEANFGAGSKYCPAVE